MNDESTKNFLHFAVKILFLFEHSHRVEKGFVEEKKTFQCAQREHFDVKTNS